MVTDGKTKIAEAEGYLELQLFQEGAGICRNRTRQLRMNPAMVRVWIACAFAAKHFEITDTLVRISSDGLEFYRKFAIPGGSAARRAALRGTTSLSHRKVLRA